MVKIKRKSQGMPINVIIIAALALVVLVVLLAIFSGRVRIFSENLQSCTAKQGQCYPKSCPLNTALITNTNCPEDNVCCVQVLST